MAQRLGGDIEIGEALNGYSQGFHIVRDGEVLLRCLTRGAGSAADTSQFLAASTASEVYPIFQELYPKHSVSRLDACEDYSGAGTWDKLEALVTEVCSLHKVTMAPFGEGHVRPDGTRTPPRAAPGIAGAKIRRSGLSFTKRDWSKSPKVSRTIRRGCGLRSASGPVPSPKSSSVLQD